MGFLGCFFATVSSLGFLASLHNSGVLLPILATSTTVLAIVSRTPSTTDFALFASLPAILGIRTSLVTLIRGANTAPGLCRLQFPVPLHSKKLGGSKKVMRLLKTKCKNSKRTSPFWRRNLRFWFLSSPPISPLSSPSPSLA